MNYFVNILFGHLFGDYIFQNKWMALGKGGNSFICFVHCLLYTLLMCLFTWKWNIVWIAVVFTTHFIIDRWSLADMWLKLIHGRVLKDFLNNGHKTFPDDFTCAQKGNYRILLGSFASLVYAVVDNTFHLAIVYFLYPYL